MELTTHAVFAFAVGLLFFGRPDIALLVTLGALVPDLDREYWFVAKKKYLDEQPHRARFHNVFVIATSCLLSPFFALGVFLHSLLDSFTTAKDRGCEWFYPLTRYIKRGRYDADGNEQTPIQPGKVYFYQEDPQGIVEHADPDLQEPDDKPTPWRRTYGPALNSSLLDRGFLIGGIALVIIWLLTPDLSHLAIFANSLSFYYPFIAGFAFFALVYFSGELDRRDRKEPLKIIPKPLIRHKDNYKKPIFVVGLIFLGLWIFLYWGEIWANLELIYANLLAIVLGAAAIVIIAYSLINYLMKVNKKKNSPVIV